ncbi:MAG TPA: prepilin-type N-terminal cleavage/methylation domain-containing protein [Planctomycetota bacterium]|nr:prepilin-type N-terminal cleavage/methylation domain-containing protein [Planctomycetota bacterium]
MKRTRDAGFSLIEVVIAGVIFFLVSGALYMMLFSAGNTYGNMSMLGDSQERARRLMDDIAKELRMADGATVIVSTTVTANDTITFRLPVVDSATGKVVVDGGGNPTWTTNIVYKVEYDTNTGSSSGFLLTDQNNNKVTDDFRITRTYNGSTQRLARYIKSGGLKFTQTGDNVVIQMTFFSLDHKNKIIDTTLRSSVTLRNSST